ncbi:ORF8 [Betacoronavirus sp. RsYN04]|nr:ORF8 [Betacoronavirus sp. RmYN05]QWN56229.1 ORF8 [Betacoronavirus sp. RmYN08]QWN56249.1 ORF8 [Betacoronavirus sp. RsYN04]
MKLLVFLVTLSVAYPKECSIQECSLNQLYMPEDLCPMHFYSDWFIKVGNRRQGKLIPLCQGDNPDRREVINYAMFANFTQSCSPFTISCQPVPLGQLILRCSYYADFIDFHDIRIVIDVL